MNKKVVFLISLLVLLGGIISAQIINREKPIKLVPLEDEIAAKATIDNFLKAGRARQWKEMEQFWSKIPSKDQVEICLELTGKNFAGEFEVVNSGYSGESKDEFNVYGSFPESAMVVVNMKKHNGDVRIVSIASM